MNPLVLIVGPTGSGKSALGLALAKAFNGAILNCDSLQTYQRLDIGTAKPSKEERALVKHFLFDVLQPGEVFTAADFRRMALEVLRRELPGKIVFGVGGSGFYIQALEKGMFDVAKPNPETEKKIHAEYEAKGLGEMFSRLQKLDPVYAEEISPNDSYRILRALIIVADSGKKVSDLRESFQTQEFPFPLLKLGMAPSREELLPRVVERTHRMIQSGLVEEVRTLIDEGYSEWPPLQSVGYKECGAFLKGDLSRDKLEPLIVEKTMQLAKKQRTWFKRDSQIHWLPFQQPEKMARDVLTRFLDSQR